ncbi:MAG TPA: hypothetical protein VMO26_29880 [Vicinamibacterales bacterium]|nr:hypothetical protein [Vicinamibacterales bacterium]
MVDALRRAREMTRPDGCVIDLHPTAERAGVLVGNTAAGVVSAGDAPERHQAASDAIDTVVAGGLFVLQRGFEFDFSVYADTIDELQEHILEDWRNARIDDETMARARMLLKAAPTIRPRVRERIRITHLRPTGSFNRSESGNTSTA